MDKSAKIFVTGHRGLVGSATVNALKAKGYENLLLATHAELDLLDTQAVNEFFAAQKPDYVFHIAAKVGGIVGNKTYPADYLYDNLVINTNVIHAAHQNKVKKLLNFGSVCIYPKFAEVPIKEESLLTGELEFTNEAYALAKITSLMLAKKYKEQYGDNFISVMPANIYGINDNFHPQRAHVIPMLIDRFHQAKVNNEPQTVVWGTGKPTRDFLNSKDVGEGLVHIMEHYDGLEHINLGPGYETSIAELAQTIKDVVGYTGELVFDTTKPDGTPRRYMDTSKVNALGWQAKVNLKDGLTEMYEWYLQNQDNLRKV
jgi:GDP-L-fucose synthase